MAPGVNRRDAMKLGAGVGAGVALTDWALADKPSRDTEADDPRLKPIILTQPPGIDEDHTVGWAVERENGGRGFGFTGGHFYENWWDENFGDQTW